MNDVGSRGMGSEAITLAHVLVESDLLLINTDSMIIGTQHTAGSGFNGLGDMVARS